MQKGGHYRLPTGTVLVGTHANYVVGRVLGRGGFGVTYYGRSDSGIEVAIKEYFPVDFAHRGEDLTVSAYPGREDEYRFGFTNFDREANQLTQFSHPNIVRALDYFAEHGTAYIVMAYIEGKTFEEWLLDRGGANPPTEKEIGAIFMPLLDGLCQVHDQGLLHRDIKPDNIWIKNDGDPILIDFGAARHTLSSHSRSIMACFAAGYSPYEQYASDSHGKVGPWTDLYSVGATMLRAISGQTPVAATDRMSAVSDDEADPLQPIQAALSGSYSECLLSTIDDCMKLRIKERPQSVADVQDRLFSLFGNFSLRRWPAPRVSVGKNGVAKTLAIVSGVLVVAAVGVGLYVALSTGEGVTSADVEHALNDAARNHSAIIEKGVELAPAQREELTNALASLRLKVGVDNPGNVIVALRGLVQTQSRLLKSAPRTFLLGSTSDEIDDAYADCNAGSTDGCVREWFTIESQKRVSINPFELDKSETTFQEFSAFVEQTGHVTTAEKVGYSLLELQDTSLVELSGYTWQRPEGAGGRGYRELLNHPVVHVSHADAVAFCAHHDKRLPTRAEWEYTFLTPGRFLFGSYHTPNTSTQTGGTDIRSVRVDSDLILDTATGMYGGTGNVWEWLDTHEPTFRGSRQTKGGSWNERLDIYFRTTAIRPQPVEWSFIDLGFRCAKDVMEWPGA